MQLRAGRSFRESLAIVIRAQCLVERNNVDVRGGLRLRKLLPNFKHGALIFQYLQVGNRSRVIALHRNVERCRAMSGLLQ